MFRFTFISFFRRSLAAALTAAFTAAGATPDPPWLLPDYPVRAVATIPAQSGTALLVSLPAEGAQPDGAAAAFTSSGAPLACRWLPAGAAAGTFRLLLQNDAPGREQMVRLYYGAPAGSARATLQPAFRDPTPISVEVRRAGGRSVPNSWDKLQYLYRTGGEPLTVLRTADFGEVNLLQGAWSGGQRRRRSQGQGWAVRFETHLLCAQAGVYRFALDTADTAFLFVNAQMAVAHPADAAPPAAEWVRGGPVTLPAGIHRLDLYSYSLNPAMVRVGWAPPGSDTLRPVPPEHLVAGACLDPVRIERQDRTLHPDFTMRADDAYAFRGFPALFLPVRVANRTRNWLNAEMTCRWRFGAAHEATGEQALYAFTGAGLHEVDLEVRDALGFAGSVRRTLDGRLAQAVEYPLDVGLENLPAVAYATDVVEPLFRIAGRTPASAPISVHWLVARHGQPDEERQVSLVPTPSPTRLSLARAEAGTLAELRWSVRHWGTELTAGRVRFLPPPFADTPVRAEGAGLYGGDGTRLVLLPHQGRGHARQPPIRTEQAFGHILCLDDTLAPNSLYDRDRGKPFDRILARIVDGPDWPLVRHETPPAWEQWPEAWGPVATLAWAPARLAAAPTDVAIVSLGQADILGVRDPALFERHLAALADLLSTTRGVPVVLVTPPPWPPDPTRLKPYAVAVRRVADARRIPVADLYTAFQAMARGGEHTFFRHGDQALNDAAQALAAQLLARALLNPGPEGGE